MAKAPLRGWSVPASWLFDVFHDERKVGTINAANISEATEEAHRRFPAITTETAGSGRKYRFHTPTLSVRRKDEWWDGKEKFR